MTAVCARFSSLGGLQVSRSRCCSSLKLAAHISQVFDVDNKYGRYALERVYEDICGITSGPMPDVVVRST